jgi:hypothetical protein
MPTVKQNYLTKLSTVTISLILNGNSLQKNNCICSVWALFNFMFCFCSIKSAQTQTHMV